MRVFVEQIREIILPRSLLLPDQNMVVVKDLEGADSLAIQEHGGLGALVHVYQQSILIDPIQFILVYLLDQSTVADESEPGGDQVEFAQNVTGDERR